MKIDGNVLTLLGSNRSIDLDMSCRGVEWSKPAKEWQIDAEPVMWFSEESAEAGVIRMINNLYRQWLNADPFLSAEEFNSSCEDINQRLSVYSLRIFYTAENMCVVRDGELISFEEALKHIMDMDEQADGQIDINNLMYEAEFQKRLGQLDRAIPLYERAITMVTRTDPVYTYASFQLGEGYYFEGNYERSVSLYYRCNLEFVENESDFYIHIGHALVDSKMKKYEREIRIYYRSRLDPDYAVTHKDAIAGATREVGEVFDEYEETCRQMGQKMYADHRNRLPVGADDVDELLAIYDPVVVQPMDPVVVKRYENINLLLPTRAGYSVNKSPNELLADALDLFINGEYQTAFETYVRISEEVSQDTDYYTWAQFQIGKLYSLFDDYEKAYNALTRCDPSGFGLVYRTEDFFELYSHVRIVCDDLESDYRYRKLIRGKFDYYYSSNDRGYFELLRDRQLMTAFAEYEKECIESARADFKVYGFDDKADTGREKEKNHKLFKKIFRFIDE